MDAELLDARRRYGTGTGTGTVRSQHSTDELPWLVSTARYSGGYVLRIRVTIFERIRHFALSNTCRQKMRCHPLAVVALITILVSSTEAAASWQRALCPNTKRPYYFNRETKEVSWTRPTGVAEHVQEGTEAAFEELPLRKWKQDKQPAVLNNVLPLKKESALAVIGKSMMVSSVMGIGFALL